MIKQLENITCSPITFSKFSKHLPNPTISILPDPAPIYVVSKLCVTSSSNRVERKSRDPCRNPALQRNGHPMTSLFHANIHFPFSHETEPQRKYPLHPTSPTTIVPGSISAPVPP